MLATAAYLLVHNVRVLKILRIAERKVYTAHSLALGLSFSTQPRVLRAVTERI